MNLTQLYNDLNITYTENGALAHRSTGSSVVDLFYNIGSIRNDRSKDILLEEFRKAFQEDKDLAFRTLLWSRDCRGGAGSRYPLKTILSTVLKYKNEDLISTKFLDKMAELGYYKDIFDLYNIKSINTSNKKNIVKYCVYRLSSNKDMENFGLFCKWFPRRDKLFYDVAKAMKMSLKEFRRFLSKNTKVVETLMCENRWNEITFSNVPSIAHKKYMNAFINHDEDRYREFQESVRSGKSKINTAVLTPVDVVRSISKYHSCYKELQEAQFLWDNLPKDSLPINEDVRILPVVDVSGSMFGDIAICASFGVGVFLAQNSNSCFKNMLLSFSENPVFHNANKPLVDIMREMQSTWGYNTNIAAIYNILLNNIIEKNAADVLKTPTHVLILSDMQFDSCTGASPFRKYKKKFEEAGMKMPKIIFWNLRANNTKPATIDDNVLLLSGYSVDVLKEVIKNGDVDALELVKRTVNKPRYMV